MSEQSGPGWHDDRRYPPRQPPQAHSPSSASGASENPKRDDQKKKPHSFSEWVNTTQGIVVIISTLITLIFGGGSAVLVIRHFISPKPAPSPQGPVTNSPKPASNSSTSSTSSPPGLTIDQVREALLTSSDLASIDSNLTSVDIAPPVVGSCKPWPIKAVFNLNREFSDGNALIILDGVAIFNSSTDAHTAFMQTAQQVTCSFTGVESTSNISNELNGICNESGAWLITNVNDNGVTLSNYLGEVRCGRAIATFGLIAPQESSFDHDYLFDKGMEIAVPKVQDLFQPST